MAAELAVTPRNPTTTTTTNRCSRNDPLRFAPAVLPQVVSKVTDLLQNGRPRHAPEGGHVSQVAVRCAATVACPVGHYRGLTLRLLSESVVSCCLASPSVT